MDKILKIIFRDGSSAWALSKIRIFNTIIPTVVNHDALFYWVAVLSILAIAADFL